MFQQAFVSACVVFALFTTIDGRTMAIMEGGYEPFCVDSLEDTSGTKARIEYGWGFEARGNHDCIILTAKRAIAIYRYILALRRAKKIQILLPNGQDKPETPWPATGALPVPIAATGIAVAEEGRVVFVSNVNATELAVFNRNLETGELTFNAIRHFLSEGARIAFVSATRKAWLEAQTTREQRWNEMPR